MKKNELTQNLKTLWDENAGFRIVKNSNIESANHIIGLIVLYKHAYDEYTALLSVDEIALAQEINKTYRAFERRHPLSFNGVASLLDYRWLYTNEHESLLTLLTSVYRFMEYQASYQLDGADILAENTQIVNFFTSMCEDNMLSQTLLALIEKFVSKVDCRSVYDPFSGLGSLLVAATKHVATTSVFYQSEDRFSALFGLLSLLLIGKMVCQGSTGNALLSPAFTEDKAHLKQFDLVVSCPPVNMKVLPDQADPYARFEFGIPAKNKLDAPVIQHIVNSMKTEQGQAIAIIPHGFLYRVGVEQAVRQSLIERNKLDAVVTLPAKLFSSKSYLPPMVLLLFKNERSFSDVLFIDGEKLNLSYKHVNEADRDFVNQVMHAYSRSHTKRDEIARYSRPVTREEIRSNNFNLSMNMYVQDIVNYNYSSSDEAVRIATITKLNTIQQDIEGAISRIQNSQ